MSSSNLGTFRILVHVEHARPLKNSFAEIGAEQCVLIHYAPPHDSSLIPTNVISANVTPNIDNFAPQNLDASRDMKLVRAQERVPTPR